MLKYIICPFSLFFRELMMLFTRSSVRSDIIAWKSSTAEKTGSRAVWACPVKSCDCTAFPFVLVFCFISSLLTRSLLTACVPRVRALLAERDSCTTGHFFCWPAVIEKWGHWTFTCFNRGLFVSFSTWVFPVHWEEQRKRALSSSFLTSELRWTPQHFGIDKNKF